MSDNIIEVLFIFVYLIVLYIAFRNKVLFQSILVGLLFAVICFYFAEMVGGWGRTVIIIVGCPLSSFIGSVLVIIVKVIRTKLNNIL